MLINLLFRYMVLKVNDYQLGAIFPSSIFDALNDIFAGTSAPVRCWDGMLVKKMHLFLED